MDFRYRGSESADGAENVIRLSASELACYRWPDDTAEHRMLRAAYMDGAASMASVVSGASAEVVQTQDDLGALLHAAEAEIERLRDEHAIDDAIHVKDLVSDVERHQRNLASAERAVDQMQAALEKIRDEAAARTNGGAWAAGIATLCLATQHASPSVEEGGTDEP
jgi:hypothetical protein